MAKTVIAVVAFIYFTVFGLLSIIWPEKVRDYYLRNYRRGLNNIKNWPSVSRWERYYPGAQWFRFFGVLGLASSLLLAYAWFKG
jgi:hypothetical protein